MNMTRATEGSLYEILEVGQSASPEEIQASYQRIVDVLAPHALATYAMFEDGEADRVRAQVDEAYRTLNDPQRRAEYDRRIRSERSGFPTVVLPRGQASEAAATPPRVRQQVVRPADRSELARAQVPASETPRSEHQLPRVEPAARARPAARQTPFVSDASSQKKRRLHPRANIDVGPDTEFSGSLLRRLRESAQASLDDVAEITKISKRYLLALEENDFDILPAFVYVRGFVSEYARALGLDSRLVAQSYMSLYRRYRGETS